VYFYKVDVSSRWVSIDERNKEKKNHTLMKKQRLDVE
jgi:hypothetical protein